MKRVTRMPEVNLMKRVTRMPEVNLMKRVTRMPPPSTNKAVHSGIETQRRRHHKSKTVQYHCTPNTRESWRVHGAAAVGCFWGNKDNDKV